MIFHINFEYAILVQWGFFLPCTEYFQLSENRAEKQTLGNGLLFRGCQIGKDKDIRE